VIRHEIVLGSLENVVVRILGSLGIVGTIGAAVGVTVVRLPYFFHRYLLLSLNLWDSLALRQFDFHFLEVENEVL
jgi:hypothetical protein